MLKTIVPEPEVPSPPIISPFKAQPAPAPEPSTVKGRRAGAPVSDDPREGRMPKGRKLVLPAAPKLRSSMGDTEGVKGSKDVRKGLETGAASEAVRNFGEPSAAAEVKEHEGPQHSRPVTASAPVRWSQPTSAANSGQGGAMANLGGNAEAVDLSDEEKQEEDIHPPYDGFPDSELLKGADLHSGRDANPLAAKDANALDRSHAEGGPSSGEPIDVDEDTDLQRALEQSMQPAGASEGGRRLADAVAGSQGVSDVPPIQQVLGRDNLPCSAAFPPSSWCPLAS